MGAGDGALWKDVDRLLRRRPGWRFRALATPGAPPRWCFGPEVDPVLTVTVQAGSISVYVARVDVDVSLATVDELLAWLIDEWPEALPEQRDRITDKLTRGHLFDWE